MRLTITMNTYSSYDVQRDSIPGRDLRLFMASQLKAVKPSCPRRSQWRYNSQSYTQPFSVSISFTHSHTYKIDNEPFHILVEALPKLLSAVQCDACSLS
jgi:hypothetical protein